MGTLTLLLDKLAGMEAIHAVWILWDLSFILRKVIELEFPQVLRISIFLIDISDIPEKRTKRLNPGAGTLAFLSSFCFARHRAT